MWQFLTVLYIFIRSGNPSFILTENRVIPFQIAAIFDTNTYIQKNAFNESMRTISSSDFEVEPVVLQSLRTDSYSMWREICANKAMRPIAILGPQNPTNDGAIRDQCALANIPHIQATWQPLDPDFESIEEDEQNDEAEEGGFKRISINYFPDSNEICVAIARVLKYYGWTSFSVLYEDDFGLMRIQKILAEYTGQFPVTIRRLNPEGKNHKVFKELKSYEESRFLLDCHSSRISQYLAEAEELKQVNPYQHYILVSMDASNLVESMIKLSCNITWLSLTDYDKLIVSQNDFASRVRNWQAPDDNLKVEQIELEALIMDDLGNHIVKSLTKTMAKPNSPICGDNMVPWQDGVELQNNILKTKTVGVTGNIEFDDRGRRVNYTLFVNEIHLNQRSTIGTWDSAEGTSIIENKDVVKNADTKQGTSKRFRIISRRIKPYFYDKTECIDNKDDCEQDTDPDLKYEGFAVDLVKEIFAFLRKEGKNYTYEFVFKEDDENFGKFGKYIEQTKKWDGLIGLLLGKEADLAVCDFTITEERKQVVDFSMPFMSLGISILYVQEHKITPGMFSFLNPYTFTVWMYIATAYLCVSICLFVCSRISPADWENPEPCDKDPEELENIWTFKNCTWLTLGSIMTQGCDILPKAFGTRWVCAMWWFFAVIICQTYIAQLSASMTSALENEPIDSVVDLAKQTKILYGAYKYGSTLDFFRTSNDKMYQQMYETMMANPVVLVDTSDEGERRVVRQKGKYAFFMESSTIDYKLKRNCDLKKVGDELDSKDYGIAMPANSPFRKDINRAILKLKESSKINDLKTIWWENRYDALTCDPVNKPDDVEGDLEMENLIGAFVVLIVGLVFCLFLTAAEFLNEVRNIVVREQLSPKEALIQELKASLNFFQLQKPVLRNPSRAPSIASSIESSEKREKEKRNAIINENFMEFEKQVQ